MAELGAAAVATLTGHPGGGRSAAALRSSGGGGRRGHVGVQSSPRYRAITGCKLLNADGRLLMMCHPKKAAWSVAAGPPHWEQRPPSKQ